MSVKGASDGVGVGLPLQVHTTGAKSAKAREKLPKTIGGWSGQRVEAGGGEVLVERQHLTNSPLPHCFETHGISKAEPLIGEATKP